MLCFHSTYHLELRIVVMPVIHTDSHTPVNFLISWNEDHICAVCSFLSCTLAKDIFLIPAVASISIEEAMATISFFDYFQQYSILVVES